METLDEVLEFWFSDHSRHHWFASTPGFDRSVARRFGDLFARAAAGDLVPWEDSPKGCLALCLLLDQVPRNLFRGTQRAFATDRIALEVARRAIANGFDRELPPEQRQFLYLPFVHSERLADQLRAEALYDGADLTEALDHMRAHHLPIIRRFGRLPHRNAVLGRPSTPEELAFLAEHSDDYGQSAVAPDQRE